MTTDLSRLFRPRSIAVVGASNEVDSPGYDYVHSLRVFGFVGEVYPVSRSATEVDGFAAHRSISAVPGPIDLVICCIPAGGVLDLVDECGAKKAPFLHLFTARFSETGDPEAAALEGRLRERARAAGVRMLGPNGLGVFHPAAGLSFRTDLPNRPGNVAVLSQSGNNAVEVLVRGAARGIGFSKAVSYGNALDMGPGELLRTLAADPETKAIGAYVEGVPNGRDFLEGLKVAAMAKPTVIHKAGRTAAGAGSAASHTAALAGSARLWSAALRQAGALEAQSQEQLLDLLVAASLLPHPRGRRVAVVGGGGGRSVQAADACEENSLEVAPLPAALREKVRERAAPLAEWLRNPVDQSILAGSGLSSNALLEMMLAGDAYDLAIANVGEEWFFGRPGAEERLRHACDRLAAIAVASPKPVAVVLGATESTVEWQRRLIDDIRDGFVAKGIAVFATVERAAWALSRLAGVDASTGGPA